MPAVNSLFKPNLIKSFLSHTLRPKPPHICPFTRILGLTDFSLGNGNAPVPLSNSASVHHIPIRFYTKDDHEHTQNKITKVDNPKTTVTDAGGYRDPVKVLLDEFKDLANETPHDRLPVPRASDIVIVGGGAIGLSVAYWLKKRNPGGYEVTVVERDPSYTQASTVLSLGGIRQQFSLPENIKMSLFTAEFLRDIKEYLSVLGMEPPDVQFNPQGYLFLSTEAGVDIMRRNHEVQSAEGAKCDLMSPEDMKEKFPWINVEDISLGSYGLANEGWFDPWLLLAALKTKCAALGVQFIKGEAAGMTFKEYNPFHNAEGKIEHRKTIDMLKVKAEDGLVYTMKTAIVINCAGAWAGQVAQMADIGVGKDSLAIPLPIEPRKRYVYMVHCPDGPGLNMPKLIDPSGMYVRREGLGGDYLCGISPTAEEEPDTSNLDVDYDLFHEKVWPLLAKRVPAFNKLKEIEADVSDKSTTIFQEQVYPRLINRIPAFQNLELKSAWAGYYDYNYFDQNLVIGNHPYHRNFFMAAGCSGHGIQHAPAIGRAIMELIVDSEYQTIDLKRFSFDRFLDDEPIFERSLI